MNRKPVLLFYCQHSLGMGHLVRALTLAESLAERFQVIFLNGGRFPDNTAPPKGIEIVNLPPLGMSEDNQLYSQDSRYDLIKAQEIRKRMILAMFEAFQPDAILIELFPFGRKKFAYELLPLLKIAHHGIKKKVLVLCSLRDIMVNARKDQVRHDNRARWLVDRYFDGILVHSDPKIARLDESFKPSQPLKAPVHYTGFVLPRGKVRHLAERKRQLLVSVGGGMVGAPLLELAIKAQPLLWEKLKLPTTLVAGPFLPEEDWQRLQKAAESCPYLTLIRDVPNMSSLLASHSISVSQCGYNTVMDILKSGVAALVVPFSQGQENEQTNRAERLSRLGLLRSTSLETLSIERFVVEIEKLLAFIPKPAGLDLNGAASSTEIIYDCVALSKQASSTIPSLKHGICHA